MPRLGLSPQRKEKEKENWHMDKLARTAVA